MPKLREEQKSEELSSLGGFSGAAWIGREPESEWMDRWRARKQIDLVTTGDRVDPTAGPGTMRIWEFEDYYQSAPVEPAPCFRKIFRVPALPLSAKLRICGIGRYDLWLNGVRPADAALDPAPTDVRKRIPCRWFELKDFLVAGDNELLVVLGRGFLCMPTWSARYNDTVWRGQPKLIATLHCQYKDGSADSIVTGPDWSVGDSSVRFDAEWPGELVDGRLQEASMCEAFPRNRVLQPATVVEGPGGELYRETMPPILRQEHVPVEWLKQSQDGSWIAKLRESVSGWFRLRLRAAERDARVTILTSERPPDCGGNLAWRYVYQHYGYVARGDEEEYFEPRFIATSFRYLKIEGYRGALETDDLVGVPLRHAFERSSLCEASEPVLVKLHDAVQRTLGGNLMGLPMDCPHREKAGWTGDAHLACEAYLDTWDCGSVLDKWCMDMEDAQLPGGQLPPYAPIPVVKQIVHPNWSACAVLVPWNLYLETGSKRHLKDHYAFMKRYVDGIEEHCAADCGAPIVKGMFGDWLPPDSVSFPWQGPDTGEPYGTAFYHLVTVRLAEIAAILGHEKDALALSERAKKIRSAFNDAFWKPELGYYQSFKKTGYRQSVQAAALYAGVVPENLREKLIEGLVLDITGVRQTHLNTGFVGTKCLMEVLARSTHHEVATALALQTSFPSWGYWFETYGLDSICENWHSLSDTGSTNHPPLASVGAWMIRHLAGIQPIAADPGYQTVYLRPTFSTRIERFAIRRRTRFGWISSAWKRSSDSTWSWAVEIPAECRIRIELPDGYSGNCSGGHSFTVTVSREH